MDLTHGPNAFTRIMAAAEGGSGLAALGAFASRFASADARIRLVDVIADRAMVSASLKRVLPDWGDTHVAMVHGAQTALTDAAKHLTATGHAVDAELLDLSVLHVAAPDALATAAHAWHADLVAIAAHPRGHRWACRLDPEEVAAATHCPVLYVPIAQLALAAPPLDRALVAIDGSATSTAALQLALARLPARVQLRVIYVVDRSMQPGEPGLKRLFEAHGRRVLDAAAPLLEGRGAAANVAMIATGDEMDDVASAILRDAKQWKADLIVAGLQGSHGRWHGAPGSVTSRALRDTACPLLVSPVRVGSEPGGRAVRPTVSRDAEPPAGPQSPHRRDSSENEAMKISFPGMRPQYHAGRMELTFPAMMDGVQIRCAITAEALEDHFGAASPREPDLVAAFDAHRPAIEAAAARMIEATGARAIVLHSGFFRMYDGA